MSVPIRVMAVFLAVAALAALAGCDREPPVVEDFPAAAERSVEVNGTRIHYFDFRPDATGTPILFLHGYSGSGYEAYLIQDDLGDRRVIAPDLPGLGLSGKPDIEYDLSYYLDFIVGFVSALDLDRFVLAGHSMGGKFAAVYTALHGSSGFVVGDAGVSNHTHLGLVEQLILLAPYGLDGEAGEIIGFLSNTGDLVNVSFNLHNQTLIDVAVRLNVFHDSKKIPEDLIDYIASATFYSENGVRALASITRNAIARDPIDWVLPEIAVPTLIIWGENDRVLSFRHATTFAGLIRDSTLVSVPECGHLPHVEQQAITAQAIVDFLRTAAPNSGAMASEEP
jgi:pimeloyl-ACP methyl ester carboxylesterase